MSDPSAAAMPGRWHAADRAEGAAHPGPRRLILLRHAKSGYPEGVADHERPLSARGRLAAAAAGTWIRSCQPEVESVLCSDAQRTRETLRHTGITAAARYDRRLYGAGAADITAVLAAVPPDVRTVLVIAHSPGIPQTAALLAGAGSDPAALATLRAGFPTSAVAVLDALPPWGALRPGTCRLLAVHVARA